MTMSMIYQTKTFFVYNLQKTQADNFNGAPIAAFDIIIK